jgi:hypothetical protein
MRSGTCWVPAHTRTVSPSAHPRSASVELRTSSWLAPSRDHQQALRPPGGEDARCVRPNSATQTNYVHPHLVRSRFALATFAAGTPHGVFGSARHDQGSGRFTTSEDRFGGSSYKHCSRALLPHGLETRAWAFSSHGADAIEPLTPLSRLPFTLTPRSLSRALQSLAVRPSFEGFRTGRRMR